MKGDIDILESLKKFYGVTYIEAEVIDKAIKAMITLEHIRDELEALPFDYEKNYMGRRYVILEDVMSLLDGE